MTPYDIIKLCQHWFRWWLGAIRFHAIIWVCAYISYNISKGSCGIHLNGNSTHWGRVMHICFNEHHGSDDGLSPGWHQAIIWTKAGILWIESLGTYFSEILIAIYTFSFKKMHLKMSSAKWRRFCLGLNVLTENAEMSIIKISLKFAHLKLQPCLPGANELKCQSHFPGACELLCCSDVIISPLLSLLFQIRCTMTWRKRPSCTGSS